MAPAQRFVKLAYFLVVGNFPRLILPLSPAACLRQTG